MRANAGPKLWLTGFAPCRTAWIAHTVAASRRWRFIDHDEALAELSGLTSIEFARAPRKARHDWISCYIRWVSAINGPIVASIPASVAERADDVNLLVATGRLIYLRCSPDEVVVMASASVRQHLTPTAAEEWVAKTYQRRDTRLLAHAHRTVPASGQCNDVALSVLAMTKREEKDSASCARGSAPASTVGRWAAVR
jgi:shikimate kinase